MLLLKKNKNYKFDMNDIIQNYKNFDKKINKKLKEKRTN